MVPGTSKTPRTVTALSYGRPVQVPTLSTYDLFSVADAITAERRKAALAKLAKFRPQMSAWEQFQGEMEIDAIKATAHDVFTSTQTLAGAEAVIRQALVEKGGHSEEQAREVIGGVDPVDLVNLAAEVVGLVRRPVQPEGEQAPLAGAPAAR